MFRLRHHVLLTVLVGGVIPLGLVGVGLVRSAETSGRSLLRSRLETTLEQAVRSLATRWQRERSELMDLVESAPIHDAMSLGIDHPGASIEAGSILRDLWAIDEGRLRAVTLRDTLGRTIGSASAPDGLGPMDVGRSIVITLPVWDGRSGPRLGDAELEIPFQNLLPRSSVIGLASQTVLSARSSESGRLLTPLDFDPGLLDADQFTWGGEEWLVARRVLGEPQITLTVAGVLGPFAEPLRSATRRGFGALFVVALMAVVLSAFLARALARPLEALASAAGDVGRGHLDLRIEPTGPREMREVNEAFNSMASELQASLDRARGQEALAAVGEFAASLAHEVRNPLSAIRLDLQRSLEAFGPQRLDQPGPTLVLRALKEISRLDDTVAGALRLASPLGEASSRVDVVSALSTAVALTEGEASGRAVLLDCRFGESVVTRPITIAHEGGLERIFLNLLLNAVQHSEEGATVQVEVEEVDDSVVVSISDRGPGIPADELERVWVPFVTRRRGGTGLGLSIVNRLAKAISARVELQNRSDGGLRAVVTLDRAAPTTHDRA